ncbi:MAG: P1 family peptidase [Hyphomicrobiaceae bacterium]|nr:P1 family peptidase [Hyphomicrobiaceae bacterium]
MASGPLNLITDVGGLTVGNADDDRRMSGVTVIVPTRPVVAAVDVRGGGPGTRETDALSLAGSVDEIHGLVLSGGSAFGLAAASAVQAWLALKGIGFRVREAVVPIVPQAVLFDLVNGGDKSGLDGDVYMALARQALANASPLAFRIGSAGAGYGATTATARGGLGSASAVVPGGFVVGALAAVNPVGSVTMGATAHFWSHPLEHGTEYGGLGPPPVWSGPPDPPPLKGAVAENTTLAVVATNARLTKPQAYRLAVMAHTGLARAIHPVHTPLDGDIVFALATGDVALTDPHRTLTLLGGVAADALSRAISRGVYHASPVPAGWTGPPAYCEQFGATPPRAKSDRSFP